ncbi:Upstream activation factor subunit UAF30 [Vitis vinifera]|uniref:Upstream activation factor subunit UAF30 n=1 Tax=Vitis vinifera TaxID=29760 RepID=A0A438H7D3_VITVI|nr:Upstream activation factor subunit UAF30 [Vitis vinifera]
MVSDQDIAKGVETLLRQSEPNSFTSLNGIVKQLEAKLGLDLSHKAVFIRDQISFLLRSHPQPLPPKDHFALQQHPQFLSPHPQIPSHFALQHHRPPPEDLNFLYPLPQPQPQTQTQPQPQPQTQPHHLPKGEAFLQNAASVAAQRPKKGLFFPNVLGWFCFGLAEMLILGAPAAAKRRGGSGGLNKVCGVSTELQAVVGEPTMPRTQIVKQLWAYIRKNNLQDPSNKRKIICDDALRLVFETDSTDMFKMNKLLAKHIIPLEPSRESSQAKRLKVDVESATESSEASPSPVMISDALATFFGTGEREMLQEEALRRVWEYIKVNQLEDPLNSMAILCDAKLQELFGCESISALGVSEMLARHHLFKRS